MNKPNDPLIATFGVRKEYESPAGRLEILKGIQFTMNHGEMALIFGRSGSGKSTFLHLLGGLDSVTAGRIMFEGEDLTSLTEKEMARMRNRKIGFVFQFYHLLPELTLYENVMVPAIISGNVDHKWIRELLRRFKLFSRRDHYPSELSGGEKQRVAIARALVNKASLVLCDEPTGNLDEETAADVIELIMELNKKEGYAFLIVTHDESLAWRHGNAYRLHDGRLVRENGGPVKIEQIP